MIHLALLNRAMRFTAVSANGVVARSVYVIVSIILALAGWGYWALVAGNIAQQLSTASVLGSCAAGFPACPAALPARARR